MNEVHDKRRTMHTNLESGGDGQANGFNKLLRDDKQSIANDENEKKVNELIEKLKSTNAQINEIITRDLERNSSGRVDKHELLASTRADIADIEMKLKLARSEMSSMEEELDRTLNDHDRKIIEINRQNKEISELQDELSHLRARISQIQGYDDPNTETDLKHLRKELDNLNRQIEELKKRLRRSEENISNRQSVLSEREDMVERLRARIREL